MENRWNETRFTPPIDQQFTCFRGSVSFDSCSVPAQHRSYSPLRELHTCARKTRGAFTPSPPRSFPYRSTNPYANSCTKCKRNDFSHPYRSYHDRNVISIPMNRSKKFFLNPVSKTLYYVPPFLNLTNGDTW